VGVKFLAQEFSHSIVSYEFPKKDQNDSSALKMKARSYEIPVFIYQNTWHIPEYKQLQQCEHSQVPYHNQSHNVNTILLAVPGNFPYLLNTEQLSVVYNKPMY